MSKPLGHKSYGSIPHLPNSRLGPKDYSIHEGQARILEAEGVRRLFESVGLSDVGLLVDLGTVVPLYPREVVS